MDEILLYPHWDCVGDYHQAYFPTGRIEGHDVEKLEKLSLSSDCPPSILNNLAYYKLYGVRTERNVKAATLLLQNAKIKGSKTAHFNLLLLSRERSPAHGTLYHLRFYTDELLPYILLRDPIAILLCNESTVQDLRDHPTALGMMRAWKMTEEHQFMVEAARLGHYDAMYRLYRNRERIIHESDSSDDEYDEQKNDPRFSLTYTKRLSVVSRRQNLS